MRISTWCGLCVVLMLFLIVGALPSAAADSYTLGVGDVLHVTVWGHPELSTEVEVRPDGYITFPLVGDWYARGMAPRVIAGEIQDELEQYVVDPNVTVMVKQFRSVEVQVIGEVGSPGYYRLRDSGRVMDAIGMAGGPTNLADLTAVTVNRSAGGSDESQIMNLDLEMFIERGTAAENPRLQDGDVIRVASAGRALVLGSVRNPGTYNLVRGMDLLDLLGEAGGPLDTADLEQAVVTRKHESGDMEIPLDLEAMMAGRGDQDKTLQPQDILYVPAKRKVIVLGEVNNPGQYPLSQEARLLDVIGAAGGVTPLAETGRISITRSAAEDQEVISVDGSRALAGQEGGDNPRLTGGDIIFVPEGRRNLLVLGEVRNPGSYRLQEGMGVLDVVAAAGGTTERAALSRATLTRESEDGLEVLDVDLQEMQSRGTGREAALKAGDVLFIPEGEPNVLVLGQVQSPGSFRIHEETRLLDVVAQAGGVTDRAGKSVSITREDSTSEVDLGALSRLGLDNRRLRPGDVVYVGEGQQQVLVLGEVRQPGYHRLSFGDRVLDGVGLAGGLTESAAGAEVTVTRQTDDGTDIMEVNIDELMSNQFLEQNFALQGGDVIIVPESYRRVLVLGAVRTPGYYAVREDQRLLDVIGMAGGMAANADETAVALTRDNDASTDTETVDVSAFVEGRSRAGNPPVRGGDIVMVPEVFRQVLVFGQVEQPGYYEMRPNERVLDVIARAGGTTNRAAAEDVTVTRHTEEEREVIPVDLRELAVDRDVSNNVALVPGDIVYVPEAERHVLVLGQVANPGYYEARDGERVLDLLAQAGGMGPQAAQNRVQLTRRQEDFFGNDQPTTKILDMGAVMAGSSDENPKVAAGDVVFVPEGQLQVLVFGEVQTPGYYPVTSTTELLDAIARAGGMTERAEADQVTLTRQVDGKAEVDTVDVAQIMRTGEGNVPLRGGEMIFVPESNREVLVLGQVQNPGMYTVRAGERVLDVLARAGGVSPMADADAATLTRGADTEDAVFSVPLHTLQQDSRGQENREVRGGDVLYVPQKNQRVLVLGQVENPGAYTVDAYTNLLDAVAMAGGPTASAAQERVTLTRQEDGREYVKDVDLRALLANEGPNIPVEGGDVIHVPEARQVLVLGEVGRPGAFNLPSGGRLLDLLALAGGTLENISSQEIMLTRQGPEGEQLWAVQYGELLQEQADQNLLLSGGDVVYVPETRRQVLVLGEVVSPGVYAISDGARVLDAIALAGGPRDRAALETVAIYRDGETEESSRLAMGQDKVLFEGHAEENPPIQGGDVIYVPETSKPDWTAIFGFLSGVRTFQQIITGF